MLIHSVQQLQISRLSLWMSSAKGHVCICVPAFVPSQPSHSPKRKISLKCCVSLLILTVIPICKFSYITRSNCKFRYNSLCLNDTGICALVPLPRFHTQDKNHILTYLQIVPYSRRIFAVQSQLPRHVSQQLHNSSGFLPFTTSTGHK